MQNILGEHQDATMAFAPLSDNGVELPAREAWPTAWKAAFKKRPGELVVNELVRAAGGVVVRPGSEGGVEVVLVHRPAYEDWTFPKGKLTADEDEATAALREVEEEAGLRCHLERLLGLVSYQDRRGRPKTVQYWVMSPLGGDLAPATNEVDEARWVPLVEARRLLTYKRDRKLLRELEQELSHYGSDGVPWSPAEAPGR